MDKHEIEPTGGTNQTSTKHTGAAPPAGHNLRTPLLIAAAVVAAYLLSGELSPEGRWTLAAAVFVVGLWVTEYIPLGASPLAFFLFVYLAGIRDPEIVLSGFLSYIPWLVLGVLLLFSSLQSSGLSKRVVARFLAGGTKSVRSVYGILWKMNLFLIPIVPSPITKVSLVFPIWAEVNRVVDRPGFRWGTALQMTYASIIGSRLFLLLPPNLLAVALIERMSGTAISWTRYLVLSWVPIAGLLLLVHLVLRATRLRGMNGGETITIPPAEKPGPLTREAKITAAVLLVVVVLWALERWHGVHPAMLIIGGTLLLILPGVRVLDWGKLMREADWSLFVLLAGALSLADMLDRFGTAEFLTRVLLGWIPPVTPAVTYLAVLLAAAAIRVLFASSLAYAAIVLPLVMIYAQGAGVNPASLALGVHFLVSASFILPASLETVTYAVAQTGLPRNELIFFGIVYTIAAAALILAIAFLYWPLVGFPAI